MSKRPFCQMALCVLLGICIAAYGNVWYLVAAVVLLGAAACYQKRWARAVLLILLLFAGWGRYKAAEEVKTQYLPYLEDQMQLSVQGKLSKKEMQNQQYIYELTSCWIGSIPQKNPVFCDRILVYSDTDVASIGEILVLDGKTELWHTAVNEGNFDEKSFYEARGIAFRLKDIRLVSVHGKEKHFREWLFQFKNRMAQVYDKNMGEVEGGILTAMVLGNKNLLDKDMKQLYQICGLSHILAISGLHISVIGMSLYRRLRKMEFHFWEAFAVAGIVMCSYGNMVGMGVSVKRAVLMFLLALGAQTAGRSYDSLNALGVAALFLLLENPNIFLDAGFQFSFAAVLGVVWLAQWQQTDNGEAKKTKRDGKSKKWYETLFQTMFVSISIQLMTLPIAAWYYFEIPIYAILVNLLVLPCMGVLLSMGIAGGISGIYWQNLAKVLLFPCQKMLECSGWLCRCFAGLPGAVRIVGKPALWKIIFYYVLLFGLKWYLQRKKEKRGFRQLVLGGILLVLLFWNPGNRFELDVLDVGQGDGSYIQTESGRNLFVDGGSSDVKKVGEYRILPFLKAKGVRAVDFWFVSHTDSDHISGLQEILALGYPVKRLVLSEEIERDEAYQRLVQMAESAGTEIIFVKEGDVLHLENASVKVLAPVSGMYYGDKNAASLVLLYEEKDFTGIFTGDIDMQAEQKLLAALKRENGNGNGEHFEGLGQVDFYKAAHHGSNGSNSKELLQELKPAVITVSCGRHNRYGHPGAEAVERMKEAGSHVFYTMESGQIKIFERKERVCVWKYRQ